MSFKSWAKAAVERQFHVMIHRDSVHGISPFVDSKRIGVPVRTILDGGANVGSTALSLTKAFPEAQIDCFEPVAETYRRLVENLRHTRCRCHRLGVGAKAGESTIHVGGKDVLSSIVDASEGTSQEVITISTVDDFVASHAIETVDLLKIDTEGYDLEVLKGAEATIRRGGIRLVYAEVGFLGEVRHVTLPAMMDHLISRGFAFLGLYEQFSLWRDRSRLSYANALFTRQPGP